MSFCHLSVFSYTKQILNSDEVKSVLSLFCHRFVTLNNFVIFEFWMAVTKKVYFVAFHHRFVTHLSPPKAANIKGYSSKVTK